MLKSIRKYISLKLLKIALLIMPAGPGIKSHCVSIGTKAARITVDVATEDAHHYNYI